MIAVLVLGLGLTAVAGLFPIAGTIQRRTYDDMVTSQMGDSVSSSIQSRGFSATDLIDPLNPLALLGSKVGVVPRRVLDGTIDFPSLSIEWGLKDRCYPTSMGGDPGFTNRPYYWVPMVRKANALDWQIFIFILKKEQGVVYGNHNPSGLSINTVIPDIANPDDPTDVPIVRAILFARNPLDPTNKQVTVASISNPTTSLNPTAYFDEGDQVLDSEGVVHRVMIISSTMMTLDPSVSALAGQLWYAQRTTNGSPTRRILTLGSGVVLK